jgi:hypothetical protein
MLKQLRMVMPIVLLGYGAMAATPALAQGAFPRSELDFQNMFWSERMMKAMDRNKDGMVSRDEFMTYMGRQYDRMDSGKKGMLTMQQFTDKKMMQSTFPASGD